MLFMRPITEHDLDILEHLAMSATLGITSLPKNRERLEKKLTKAVMSFNTEITSPRDELYLFLLEDSETGNVGGITGIVSKIGAEEPVHFFNVELTRPPNLKILRPVSYTNGPSEICSLFLLREFRSGGLGKLLSLCRFLFIASHPKRFETHTIAEMRGYIKNGTSPLWNAVGKHFFDASFEKAMKLRDEGKFDLSNIIPEFPIYLSLLPKSVQDIVGKIHPNTKPALLMLEQQGFYQTTEIDIFDAGPKLEAVTHQINAVVNSTEAKVDSIGEDNENSLLSLVSNTSLDFRACECRITIEKNGSVILPRDAAKALKVEPGSNIRYYKLGKA